MESTKNEVIFHGMNLDPIPGKKGADAFQRPRKVGFRLPSMAATASLWS